MPGIKADHNIEGHFEVLDSLEATITSHNEPHHLPVLTFSDADQILTDGEYAVRVVSRLREFLFDLDNIRGTGGLHLP
jgi:hypothetical protein